MKVAVAVAALVAGLGLGWVLAAERSGEMSGAGHASKSGARAGSQTHGAGRVLRSLVGGNLEAEDLRALIDEANSVPYGEIERLLDEVEIAAGSPEELELVSEILHRRLLESDPERLLKRCLLRNKSAVERYAMLWARRDAAAACGFVTSRLNPSDRIKVGRPVLREIAQNDPEQALRLVGEWAGFAQRGYWMGESLRILAKSNRVELLENHLQWPSGIQKTARNAIAAMWLEDDFAGGLGWLQEQSEGGPMLSLALATNENIARGIRQNLSRLPEGWLDDVAKGSAEELVGEDPAWWLRADQESLGITAESERLIRLHALYELTTDPAYRAEAMAFAQASSGLDQDSRQTLVRGLIGRWDQDDHAGAEAWLASLGNEELAAAGREVWTMRDEPPEARPFPAPGDVIRNLAEGERHRGRQEVQDWTREGLRDARKVFANLQAPQRDQVAALMIDRVEHPPAMMADTVSHVLARQAEGVEFPSISEKDLVKCLCNTAADWGRMHPEAAAEWVESLPPGEERQWAARNVVLSWQQVAPDEARAWAESLPEDVNREQVLGGLEP